jgi:hypothetical protein
MPEVMPQRVIEAMKRKNEQEKLLLDTLAEAFAIIDDIPEVGTKEDGIEGCAYCGGWPLRPGLAFKYDHQPGCFYMRACTFREEHK